MEWTDEGIILGVRRHGEANAIVELMTSDHGRHMGMVRGGASRRHAPHLQVGNRVNAQWRARLHEQLGSYVVEVTAPWADRIMQHGHAAFGFGHVAELLRLLPERDPHPAVYAALATMTEHIEHRELLGMMVARLELLLLAELGYGLDLDACAATGGRNDLRYVSPKSGRAVSGSAGEPWRNQLFDLPYFLISEVAEPPAPADIQAAFRLTGYFLEQRVLAPRRMGLSAGREALLTTLLRQER